MVSGDVSTHTNTHRSTKDYIEFLEEDVMKKETGYIELHDSG